MFKKLYSYQKKILHLSKSHNKGIFCLPTGTGKTYCEASILAYNIKNNKESNIYVVNAPRILLSYQLLKETYNFLTRSNIEARYMFVHSGSSIDEQELEEIRINSNIPYSQIISTTKIDNIVEMINKASAQNLSLIIFSTYNSSFKIEIARKQSNSNIEIMINDEAHYLVREDFHYILNELKSNKRYFFTATMINTPSNKGRGMNNKKVYGKVLYYMTPRQAIDKGKMVRPRLHILTTEGVYDIDDYQKSLNKIIYKAFKEHTLFIKQEPKLLISVKGTLDIKKFLNSNEYELLRKEEVDVYAVSSNDTIGNNINKVKTDRLSFLTSLKKNGEDINKKLIVLHYDILSEGIDVSGFTGLLPLRSLSKSKFLQTYGRCARLDKTDRINIENKTIKSYNLDELNKPYSYIIIPNVVQSNEDDKSNFIKLITELRSYGFKPVEHIVSLSNINGIPEIDELENLNDIQKRFPNIGNLIEKIESDLEDVKNAKLNNNKFLSKYFKL